MARFNSIRALLALAVENILQIKQIDVTTAYLNGYIDIEMYMNLPNLYYINLLNR